MRKIYFVLFSIMLFCVGCQWNLSSQNAEKDHGRISIERFDRLERHFLTSGDIAALQQMKTDYPVQTQTLIEHVLRLGHVDAPDINSRFLIFFQDSTLQALIEDVEKQYSDMSDLERELSEAFQRLEEMIPIVQTPKVYAQIGSLDQSIVVGDGLLGISLDKYLGTNHPIYLRYGYTEMQRAMMKRDYIVPDCLSFYLLSLYPFAEQSVDDELTAKAYADKHMAKIQYVVNKAMRRKVFNSENVKAVESYMASHPKESANELLAGK